jgi:hypothetical protein
VAESFTALVALPPEWIDRAKFDPRAETLIALTGEKAHHFGRFHIAGRMNVESSSADRPSVPGARTHHRPVPA